MLLKHLQITVTEHKHCHLTVFKVAVSLITDTRRRNLWGLNQYITSVVLLQGTTGLHT